MFVLSCDILTGDTLAELPAVLSGEITRAMMTVTSATFHLPVRDKACPPGWDGFTAPWRVILVVADEDTIWWAGVPTARAFNAVSGEVEITASSLEAYLGRRYVPAHTFTQTDQADIAAWLVRSTLDAGIPFEIDAPRTGVLRDRTYTLDEAGTVLQRLTNLAEVVAGPEWWIETVWRTRGRQDGVRHIFHCAYPRLGVASTRPHVVFEMPGGLTSVKIDETWGEGEAATFVVVTGEGEGEDKPTSREHVAVEQEWAGYPRLEYRGNAQNVKEVATLDAKAARTLARISRGTRVLSLSQLAAAPPKLGVDWGMGDDVRVCVHTDTVSLDEVLRLVGWKIDAAGVIITPIVADMNTEKHDK